MIIKNFRKAKFVTISITMIILFVFVMTGSINSLKNLLHTENGITPKNNVAITFDTDLKEAEFIKVLNKLQNDRNLVLNYTSASEFSSYESNVYGVYYDENYELGFNLIEGRYFSSAEIKSDEKLAVVGLKMLDSCIEENGQRYIFRGDDKYKIIGIIGNNKDVNKEAAYDYTIIYNLNSILNHENLSKEYWDIGSNVYSNDEIISKVTTMLGNDVITGISYYKGLYPEPLKAAIAISFPLVINCIFIIICLIFTLLRAIVYWIDYLKLEFGVRLAFGATKKDILKLVVKRYFLIYIVSTFGAIIINYALKFMNINNIFNYEIKFDFIIYSFIFLCILSLITIPFIINIINKIKISELLKENR